MTFGEWYRATRGTAWEFNYPAEPLADAQARLTADMQDYAAYMDSLQGLWTVELTPVNYGRIAA